MITFENIAHLIFILGVGQGMMMAVVFYKKSLNGERSLRYLAFVLVVFSIVLLYWLGYWRGVYTTPGILYGIGFALDPIDLLLGPAIYFFIRSKLDDGYRISGKAWLHFLPFVLLFFHGLHGSMRAITGDVWYRLANSAEEAAIVGGVYSFIKHSQFVMYAIWIWKLVPFKSNDWLKYVAWVYLINVLGGLLYISLSYTGVLTLDIDYAISLVIVTGIYSISYCSSLRPNFFKKQTSYEHSSLSAQHESLICEEVMKHMRESKSYLNSNYSLSQLADEIQVPRHHVSQAINRHLGKTFSSMLNEMRVQEATQRLSDPYRKEDKILKVALESGFNNKVSFHRYFKEKTGLSPSEFRASKLAQVAE